MLISSLLLLDVSFSLQAQVEKISSDLQEEMAQRGANELIPIVINLEQQPDLDNLKYAIQGMTRSQRKDYVTNQLKTIAATTQAHVLSYLTNRENEEKAQMIKSIYLANVIAVKLQNHLVPDIADMSEVNYIFLDHESFDLAETTWNVEKIRADSVWQSYGYTGDGILVGVMDTGTDYDHTDLHSNVWNNLGEDADEDGHTLELVGGEWVLDPGDLNGEDDDGNGYIDDLIGWDWKNGSSEDNDPMDDLGHGTHVAGIIAGDGTDGTQTGVAPDAKLMVLKIWQYGSAPSSNYWSAVEYALENGADVVSLSGGKRYWQVSDAEKATFRQVFETAITAGMVIVVAAGNEGHHSGGYDPPNNIRTPGNVPMVITVGATDINDSIAYFSSRGPVEWWDLCKPADEWGPAICYNDYPYPPGLLKPDVSAPGVNVTSTKWGGDYTIMSGTSMATPASSGAVALMLEAAPNMPPEMVKNILEETALDLGPAGKDSLYGSGRIDAYEAVDLIISPPSAPYLFAIRGRDYEPPHLFWSDGGEPDIDHFVVKKQYFAGSPIYVEVEGNSYIDTDVRIKQGGIMLAEYWVKAVDVVDQSSPWSNKRSINVLPIAKQVSDAAVEPDLPGKYHLGYNTPNPFNPTATLRYDLPEASRVSLTIYDVMGPGGDELALA